MSALKLHMSDLAKKRPIYHLQPHGGSKEKCVDCSKVVDFDDFGRVLILVSEVSLTLLSTSASSWRKS